MATGDLLDVTALEFLFRQPEVQSALVRGQSMSRREYLAAHPELEDDELLLLLAAYLGLDLFISLVMNRLNGLVQIRER